MEDALVTSAVALVTAVLVALWNVGGRGALARRTIKQELEIAVALPMSPERQRLERLARERAALYVHRRTTIGPSPTTLRRLAYLTILGLPGFMAALFIIGSISDAYWNGGGLEFTFVIFQVLFVLFAGLVGYWVSRAIRLWRFRHRERELEEVRAALDPPSEPGANLGSALP